MDAMNIQGNVISAVSCTRSPVTIGLRRAASQEIARGICIIIYINLLKMLCVSFFSGENFKYSPKIDLFRRFSEFRILNFKFRDDLSFPKEFKSKRNYIRNV